MEARTVIRVGTYMAPLVAFIVSAGAIGLQQRRLSSVEADLRATRQEADSARRLIKDMEGQKSLSRYPTAAMTSQEQPSFLNMMRAYAELNHVSVVRWTSTTPPKTDASVKALPPDVTPLFGLVEVDGRYADLRAFLYDMLKSPRLVNMAEMKWVRGGKSTEQVLTCTLARYVVPPGKDSAAINVAATETVDATPPVRATVTDPNALSRSGPINVPNVDAATPARRVEPDSDRPVTRR